MLCKNITKILVLHCSKRKQKYKIILCTKHISFIEITLTQCKLISKWVHASIKWLLLCQVTQFTVIEQYY